MTEWVWRSGDSFQEAVLSFHHWGPGYPTGDVWLGSRCLHPQSHQNCPTFSYLGTNDWKSLKWLSFSGEFLLRRVGDVFILRNYSLMGTFSQSRRDVFYAAVDSHAASELTLAGGPSFLCPRHLCSKFIDSPSLTAGFITYLLCDLGQINPVCTSIFSPV